MTTLHLLTDSLPGLKQEVVSGKVDRASKFYMNVSRLQLSIEYWMTLVLKIMMESPLVVQL